MADLNAQPMAAQGLAGLATNAGGLANQGYGALTGYQSAQNTAKAQSMGGVGSIVGTLATSPANLKPWWA